MEWHDSDDDDYFSDDENLFSIDKDLFQEDDNDVESSVKYKLWSLFQFLLVTNDEIINEMSNKVNHNLSRGLQVQQRFFTLQT